MTKIEAILDKPGLQFRVTCTPDRLIVTGGAHEDAYAPVDIPVQDAWRLLQMIEQVCGLKASELPPK